VKPASPSAKRSSAANLHEIDGLFMHAGLVRSLRGSSSAHFRPAKFDRAAPEELSRSAASLLRQVNGVQWLSVPGWDDDRLWSGFSTRIGGRSRAYCADDAPGELNLGFTAQDSREAVVANRKLLVEAVTGNPSTPLITLCQFHSNRVVRVTAADAERPQPWKADGAITDVPGLVLGILTADCIPVLIADPKRRIAGAFHAGWRGTVKRIVETGVGRMRLEFGSRPEDMVAAIGPGIGQCCYAVGEEVLSEFESQFSYGRELFREVYDSDPVRTKYPMLFLTQRAPGHSPIGPSLHVDLIEANHRQLVAAGVGERSIQIVAGCTQCHPELFFSHRGSRGHAGRLMAVIGMQSGAKKALRLR
jgi:purine-nucleoside/S-methyl-5'-thioadenosine phosphorylase / adenosine deaminase